MKITKFLAAAMLDCILAACGTTNTVPITGRKTHLLVSDSQVLSLSTSQYKDYMKTAKISTNQEETAMVKRVGTRLATAVETYLKNNGYQNEIKNFQWEFNLVQSQEVNAFCMPGGKIVVYEGLLPVTKDEQSLAIVLGHEIAHAVAKHSAEQLSKQIRQQYATKIGSAALSAAGLGSSASSILEGVANSGFKFANLKYSRDNESEADHLGLIFAAMAGYDPQCAIPFWQRMASGSSNKSDMFSDHPSDEKRIAALQKEMPEALKYYNAYKAQAASQQAAANKGQKVKSTSVKKVTPVKKKTSSSAKKRTTRK